MVDVYRPCTFRTFIYGHACMESTHYTYACTYDIGPLHKQNTMNNVIYSRHSSACYCMPNNTVNVAHYTNEMKDIVEYCYDITHNHAITCTHTTKFSQLSTFRTISKKGSTVHVCKASVTTHIHYSRSLAYRFG